jgi:hypothetical protein
MRTRILIGVAGCLMAVTGCSSAVHHQAGDAVPAGNGSPSSATPTGLPSSAAPVKSATTGATVPAKAPSHCHSADLSVRLVTPSTPTDAGKALLVFTNNGGHACVMKGFPGIDLLGADVQPWGPRYSLTRQEATAQTVQLSAGASAHSVITYLSGASGTGDVTWYPTSLVTTPPGESTQLTVAWPSSISVLRQDAATHPGTYLGPIQPGSQ